MLVVFAAGVGAVFVVGVGVGWLVTWWCGQGVWVVVLVVVVVGISITWASFSLLFSI